MSEKLTIGQALQHLHKLYWCRKQDLIKALKTSAITYWKIEQDRKELTLVMAVRLCRFYDISLNDLVDLIDPAEFERKELSAIRLLKQKIENIDRDNDKHLK